MTRRRVERSEGEVDIRRTVVRLCGNRSEKREKASRRAIILAIVH